MWVIEQANRGESASHIPNIRQNPAMEAIMMLQKQRIPHELELHIPMLYLFNRRRACHIHQALFMEDIDDELPAHC